MKYVMVNTGATKGALILHDSSRLAIEATAEINENKEVIEVLQGHPITSQVPDPYIKEFGPQSILCCPIINQSTVTGVVYLENKLQGSAFTPKRIEIIQSLMPTASVYIKNAKLTKTNCELTEALKDSSKAENAPKYKIDAPVQRAIDILQSLKARMVAQGDPTARQIDFIMTSLTSSDLFMDFEFDVFQLGELTNGQPLFYLSMHLLQYYGLIEHFNIDIDVAKEFFREVEHNYRSLSYHNR
ncbi:hypothetical protein HDU98_011135 [Podochytrium sp. JEL0797]|nr:hypothetical protein HDU98_011135 [Podochytrium sp. JEL0797]